MRSEQGRASYITDSSEQSGLPIFSTHYGDASGSEKSQSHATREYSLFTLYEQTGGRPRGFAYSYIALILEVRGTGVIHRFPISNNVIARIVSQSCRAVTAPKRIGPRLRQWPCSVRRARRRDDSGLVLRAYCLSLFDCFLPSRPVRVSL